MRATRSIIHRFGLAPLLAPVLMLPAFLFSLQTRPLQLVSVAAATALVYASAALAIAAAAAYVVLLGAYVFVKVRRINARAGGGSGVSPLEVWRYLSSFVFTAGLVSTFVFGLIWIPSAHPLAAWFVALGVAYYVASLAAFYVIAFGSGHGEVRPAARRPEYRP